MAQVTKLLTNQVEAITERRQALITSAVTGEFAVSVGQSEPKTHVFAKPLFFSEPVTGL